MPFRSSIYDRDPHSDPDAVKLPVVLEINDSVRALAGGTVSKRGTGGMVTKLSAAQSACEAGIDTYIMSGEKPERIYDLIDGQSVGTHFVAKRIRDRVPAREPLKKRKTE